MAWTRSRSRKHQKTVTADLTDNRKSKRWEAPYYRQAHVWNQANPTAGPRAESINSAWESKGFHRWPWLQKGGMMVHMCAACASLLSDKLNQTNTSKIQHPNPCARGTCTELVQLLEVLGHKRCLVGEISSGWMGRSPEQISFNLNLTIKWS